MRDLKGKVAVVTGGGSGIGRGTVLALAEAGMHVCVSDIDVANAQSVADEAAALGVKSIAIRTDVTDAQSVRDLADAAWAEFGAVHVLHNNAGVVIFQQLSAMTDDEWKWILNVNVNGVVNGLQAFLPRLLEQEGRKHVVNTASMAGFTYAPSLGAYNASKAAVVAISETLHAELESQDVGVSVVCPGGVRTQIFANAVAQRPAGGFDMERISLEESVSRMLEPEHVGQLVRHAIENDWFYVFTHPEFAKTVRRRFDRVLDAFDQAKERDA